MKKIGIVGAGRLGLCLALNLERVGYSVCTIDVSEERVKSINAKKVEVEEPFVQEYLSESTKLHASTQLKTLFSEGIDFIFICVPTPSLPDGKYDHSYIDKVIDDLLKLEAKSSIDLIINATTMPGYCDSLQKRLEMTNYMVSYNPEFIAQGSIIRDQQFPDQVLIGEANAISGDRIAALYSDLCPENPPVHGMTRTSAEITKLAVNCFLTTKIAFANSIGDLAIQMGADHQKILESIGSDSRIGASYLKYGFGFGGPCLPRDNRALAKSGEAYGLELHISKATNQSNLDHLNFQFESWLKKEEPILFDQLSYKADTDLIEESQQLALAVKLMRAGKKVVLRDSLPVIRQIRELYADSFVYEIKDNE